MRVAVQQAPRRRPAWPFVVGGVAAVALVGGATAIALLLRSPAPSEVLPEPAPTGTAQYVPPRLRHLVEPMELPAATNVRELRSATNVVVSKQGVYCEDELVESSEWVAHLDEVKRADGLFGCLKAKREDWKSRNPGQDFPGQAVLWVDRRLQASVAKSVLQTTTYSGYPNLSFIVHDAADRNRLAALEVQPRRFTPGRIHPTVIQRIVRTHYSRLRACYEQGLGRNPNLRGRVSVSFVIGRDGKVTRAELAPPSPDDPTLLHLLEAARKKADQQQGTTLDDSAAIEQQGTTLDDSAAIECMLKVFRDLEFPEPDGGIVTVVYPIMFEPDG